MHGKGEAFVFDENARKALQGFPEKQDGRIQDRAGRQGLGLHVVHAASLDFQTVIAGMDGPWQIRPADQICQIPA